MPLAQQALDTLSQAVRVHAEGPDPHRDLPEARRLRRAQRRLPGHDRRARRLLRPRRDDGFAAGAAAGRVPVGSDALARAGARHHAADVEPARAALADRRHLGVRGDASARRVGPRRWTSRSPGCSTAARRSSCGPERRVSEPEDDLARVLPGVAARRAPRRRVRRRRACTSCCAPTARARHRRGAEGGAEHRLRSSCRPASISASSSGSARCARRSRLPEGRASCSQMPLEALRALAAQNPRSYPVQMALGHALRKARRRDEAIAGVRARGRAGADRRPATTARTRRSPQIALEKKDRPRAIAALQALLDGRLRQRRGRAQLAALLRESGRHRSGDAAAGLRADRRRSIRSTPRRTPRSAASRCSATMPTPRSASSARSSRSSRSIRRPRYTDLAESYLQGRQARRSEASRRSPRSRSRRATSARRTCC